jgi:hypothetical protein
MVCLVGVAMLDLEAEVFGCSAMLEVVFANSFWTSPRNLKGQNI